MRYLTYLISILIACSALAEEVVRLPLEKLPVGTIFVYEVASGAVEVRRVTVNDGRRFELDIITSNPEKPVEFSMVTDNQGLVIEHSYPSGTKFTFEPHNCMRVVGDCEYSFTNPNGAVYKRKYHSEMVDGALHIQVMNDSEFVLREHRITFDDDGLALVGTDGREDPNADVFIRKLLGVIYPKD
jgi:hypothetical protein